MKKLVKTKVDPNTAPKSGSKGKRKSPMHSGRNKGYT